MEVAPDAWCWLMTKLLQSCRVHRRHTYIVPLKAKSRTNSNQDFILRIPCALDLE